uniref:Ubiquitin-like protease family profile domain-containing protein n=1 Tax=Zea mays TaxID=4577 RepID=A0A804P2C0_MAIZE
MSLPHLILRRTDRHATVHPGLQPLHLPPSPSSILSWKARPRLPAHGASLDLPHHPRLSARGDSLDLPHLPSTKQKETQRPLTIFFLASRLCHNKPKKSVATAIVPEDYICTQGDPALIDFIKEIPCEPRVEVVLIDDAFVERKSMECLFQPNAYLGDEVFIPINIRETHWYLAVIHASNMEIQVLDSLGTSQDRKDLTDSIKGLQRQIDMISQRKELKDHRWPNLQVASWPLREIDMGYAKQTDSSSCGLFLLNYIEYWTGDELSDSFTQDDMGAKFQSF